MPLDDLNKLTDYVAGELSPDEVAEIEIWIAEDEDRRAMVSHLRRMQDALRQTAETVADPGRIQYIVAARLHSPANTPTSTPSQSTLRSPGVPSTVRPARETASLVEHRTFPRVLWYSLAALAVAVVGVVLGWQVPSLRLGSGHVPAMATYVTGNGQRASITLTDGTTVALDVASRLEVPADYSSGDHALRLQGAAVFTVAHHERNPLTVTAGGTTARVLGTRFVMRHYPTDTATIVAVREGKVAVQSVVVTAARQVEVNKTGVYLQTMDPSQFAFTTGVLTFDKVPLATAIADLDRWYDVDVRLSDPRLATRRVDGEFAAGTIRDLAVLLKMTFDVNVVQDGRVLTLYQK